MKGGQPTSGIAEFCGKGRTGKLREVLLRYVFVVEADNGIECTKKLYRLSQKRRVEEIQR